MARDGWNGKDQYVFLHEGLNPTPEHPHFITPAFYIVFPNNTMTPWTPSQSDMMASDWHEIGS